MDHLDCFFLSETKPKNAFINPLPKFGIECKHLRQAQGAYAIYVLLFLLNCAQAFLQFFYFQALLNHRANACSFLITKVAQLLANFFHSFKSILTKKRVGRIFSQTHLVTLPRSSIGFS
jgi:hypothetical protein